MKNSKMNIQDLKNNTKAVPTNDLQKVKGGLSQPPPDYLFYSEPPPFGAETFERF